MPGHRAPPILSPSPWIERFAPLVVDGAPVLDIASGRGRHAQLFLARGHPVTAIDRDLSLLDPPAGTPGLTIIEADLEGGAPWPLDNIPFGAVVVANYLHRPLFPALIAALAPDGVLIYETFAAGNERFGRPRNPDYLLQPGELLDMVRGRLRIIAYEDVELGPPRAAMIQRICARAPGSVR